jgi:disulfide bond formation protein DsbB
MRTPQPRLMGPIAAALAAGALGVAFASEWWGGLVPCTLCLWERWPYRIAIAVGLLVAVAPRGLVRPAIGVLVLTILAASVLAAVHTGVELHWWPSPFPECSAPKFAGGTIAERLKAMPLLPAKPCDEPTYLVPFPPVSMAAMNFLFSLALAGFVSLSLRGKAQSR